MFAGLQSTGEPNQVSLLRLRKTPGSPSEDASVAGYTGGSEAVPKLLNEAQIGVEARGESYGFSFYFGDRAAS